MSDCVQDVPAFVDLNCDFEQGRINAIAFVDQDKAQLAIETPALLSDPTFWTDLPQPASVLIHQNVSGSYTGADTTIAGKGNQQTRLGGKNHTATVRIESVKNNEEYWNKLNISTNYYVALITDNYNLLLFSTVKCGISGNLILEDSLESITEWESTITWSDIALPITSDVPVGIFQ